MLRSMLSSILGFQIRAVTLPSYQVIKWLEDGQVTRQLAAELKVRKDMKAIMVVVRKKLVVLDDEKEGKGYVINE